MQQQKPIAIRAIYSGQLESSLAHLPEAARTYALAMQYSAARGEFLAVPGETGQIATVLLGFGAEGKNDDAWLAGKLPGALPEGQYELCNWPVDPVQSAVAFRLGNYRYSRFGKPASKAVHLHISDSRQHREVKRVVEAVSFGRDLVNAPASALGPDALHETATAFADQYGGSATAIVGEALLAHNFPMIHAVGRASQQQPRLLDLRFGDPSRPKITLVGKGVCFDTGGLDIKPSAGMLLMKKDMGGAAAALSAAMMICDAQLPVHLRVLLPIVENAIAGNAFRPGDVLQSRKGLTVEIGNTDAEGRLILADALTFAGEEKPELLFDFATLTGAARVALGADLPPFYTGSDALADQIADAGRTANDPVWRLPLWDPYHAMIESKVADINNSGGSAFAGSMTAALFLSRFVSDQTCWAHFDIYGWNPATKPGRPEGGEVQAARLIYALLRRRFDERQS